MVSVRNALQIQYRQDGNIKQYRKDRKKIDDTNTNQSTLQNKENDQSPRKMHNDKKLNSKKT